MERIYFHHDQFDMHIVVFKLEIDVQSDIEIEDWQVLSHQEQTRAMAYRQRADKLRFARTRVALKRKLAERLQVDVADIELVVDEFGKPILADGAIKFNVSHSAQKALIVLSEIYDVGVDIELAKPTNLLVNELADMVYSPLEKQRIRTGELPCEFAETWVGKEAVIKALGVGLKQDLSAFSVIPKLCDANGIKTYDLIHSIESWSNMHLKVIYLDSEYRAALCVRT